jgi:hypothetical protein
MVSNADLEGLGIPQLVLKLVPRHNPEIHQSISAEDIRGVSTRQTDYS